MNATLTEAALTAFKAAMVAASVPNAGAIVVPRSSQTLEIGCRSPRGTRRRRFRRTAVDRRTHCPLRRGREAD
jgi:hypothetical protein